MPRRNNRTQVSAGAIHFDPGPHQTRPPAPASAEVRACATCAQPMPRKWPHAQHAKCFRSTTTEGATTA